MPHTSPPEVVVAGGGIAALELVLALRELAGDRVHVTVASPQPELLLRPLLVAEPLGATALRRPSWMGIAEDVGARFAQTTITAVDPVGRRALLRGGGALSYDALVLAPGVQRLPAFDDVIHIGDEPGTRALEALREEIRSGDVRSVAFVAPTLTGWLLPLYEAAMLSARLDTRVNVSLISSEQRPLALFGDEASAIVERELEAAGVEFVSGHRIAVSEGAVEVGGARIPADRIVSLPLVRGPHIEGVPSTGVYNLIPVDEHCRIAGLPDAYAVGDATDFPIKQGGIACQQADAAAAHTAARHSAPVTPAPFRPRLQATLITGAGAPLALGQGKSQASKLPGRYLPQYLLRALSAQEQARL